MSNVTEANPMSKRQPRVAVRGLALTVLIVALLFHNQLLSLFIWPPWQPTDSQTLIPPLHEVWHASVGGGRYDYDIPWEYWNHDIILAGSGIVVKSRNGVDFYDANSGRVLGQYMAETSDITVAPSGISIKNGNILFTARTIQASALLDLPLSGMTIEGSRIFFVTSNKLGNTSGQNDKPGDLYLTATELDSGKVIWQQPAPIHWQQYGSAMPQVLWQPQPDTIIGVFNKPGGLDNQAIVIALDPQTGGAVWRSDALEVASLRWSMANGGDTIYLEAYQPGNSSQGKIIALNAGSGATRWMKGSDGFPADLSADTNYAYLHQSGKNTVSYFWQDGTKQIYSVSDSTDKVPHQDDGRIFEISRVTSGQFIYILSGDRNSTGWLDAGKHRLDVFNVSDGRAVWHSSPFNAESLQPVIGNGMLYIVHDGELRAYASARLSLCIRFPPSATNAVYLV